MANAITYLLLFGGGIAIPASLDAKSPKLAFILAAGGLLSLVAGITNLINGGHQ